MARVVGGVDGRVFPGASDAPFGTGGVIVAVEWPIRLSADRSASGGRTGVAAATYRSPFATAHPGGGSNGVAEG